MGPKHGVTRGKNVQAEVTAEKKVIFRRWLRPRRAAVTRSVKAGLLFPVGRIRRYLKEGRYAQHVTSGAPVYLPTVLEYLAAEALELARNVAKDEKKSRIIPRHLMIGFASDEELDKLLAGITIAHGSVVPFINPVLISKAKKAAKSPKKNAQSPKNITESPKKP